MRRVYIPVIVLALALLGLSMSVFVVDERQSALVLQFGQVKEVKKEPGLGFKIPIIQQVVRYDDRILALDTEPLEVTPSDDRRLIVDAFARYRIEDVVQFRQAVGVGGIRSAESRLAAILVAQTRAVLGSEGVTSNTILSADRSELMERIRDESAQRADALGLNVIDVRLKQTALPDQNLDATFARMRAEREREATDERARGREGAQRVRAQADRTVVELVSEARREAEITRGQADARRSEIFARAYGANPEFFEFYRSLAAYRRSIEGNNSSMVLSPNSEFFEYLKAANPNDVQAPAPADDQPPAGDSAQEPASEGDAEAASGADDTQAEAGGEATVTSEGETATSGGDTATSEGEAATIETDEGVAAPVN